MSSKNANTAWLQRSCNGFKGGVLGHRIERRHEGVTLLSALGLQDLMLGAGVVGPHVAALAAVELAGERQQRGKLRSRAQPFEHGLR